MKKFTDAMGYILVVTIMLLAISGIVFWTEHIINWTCKK